MNSKKCAKCKESLDEDHFYKIPHSNKLRSYCKTCMKNEAKNNRRKLYKKNKERILVQNKQWRHENNEYFKKYLNKLNKEIRSEFGIGYTAFHNFIRHHKEKPDLCEICKKKIYIELHCIDHKYTQNINDWIYICKKCHHNENIKL